MSFCDFNENVEDAIDQGCAYDDEETTTKGAPQLLWLSDIPLFQSIKAMKPGGHSFLSEEDNDTELQCTYQSSRVAYRDETGLYAKKRVEERKQLFDEDGKQLFDEDGKPIFVDPIGFQDGEEDDEWADTDVVKKEFEIDENGKFKRVPDDLPDWYEKYSSFLSIQKGDVLIEYIAKVLSSDARIFFTVKPGHCQIQGSIALQEKDMQFHINVFEDVGYNNMRLVEFQRQAGCMLDFQALYRGCLSSLNELENVLAQKIHSKNVGCINFSLRDKTVLSVEELAVLEQMVPGYTDTYIPRVPFTDEEKTSLLSDVYNSTENCEKRFASSLTAVRNEVLMDLNMSMYRLLLLKESQPFDDTILLNRDKILSVLHGASRNLPHFKQMTTEMARLLASISCIFLSLSKKDNTTRNLVSEIVVNQLTPFIKRDKLYKRHMETTKQIINLFAMLYEDINSSDTFVSDETLPVLNTVIEAGNKRLETIDIPSYMECSLRKTLKEIKIFVDMKKETVAVKDEEMKC